jgi:dynein heavy chain
MNFVVMQTIFMGLSQTGAWGCFDEFNRIKIEVLSVVSTLVKMVLDALTEYKYKGKTVFPFNEHELNLRPTVGFFITMNPGYAGRTELPENLKALFRSCAMVVPDITLICENMLMSEGFEEARDLSKKFMCLYDLSKSLLSKQMHYDWGLRAVKSVLRQAGGLKRTLVDDPERLILMRGLKYFNYPKIVTDDWPIFCGLIDALFANLEAHPFTSPELEVKLLEAGKANNLQVSISGETGLLPKCVQFHEILDVRHSVFIIGEPGSAKTTIWKTLRDAYNLFGDKDTIAEIIDPKAMTSNELYGFINPKTKDWKDGALSVIMRNMNKCLPPFKESHLMKWVILDGDVDPEWIETMNTVMDDNKVLTLVSQERIPMTDSMRLVLEVANLSQASPATVSRGGVLFVNETDIGWEPYFTSWLAKYKNDEYADSAFTLAQNTYLQTSMMDSLKEKNYITPVCDMQKVASLTCIVDFLYDKLHTDKGQLEHLKALKEEGNKDAITGIYDCFFVFACMWALGGGMDEDKLSFSSSWKSASKKKFPEAGQCFDYFYDPLADEWVAWDTVTPPMDTEYEGLYQNLIIPTSATTCQRFLLNMHMLARKGMLYVGKAGTGKTTNIKDYLSTINTETTLCASMSFNSYTDSKTLQALLESQIVKQAGKIYGPPPGKVLIYFLDDLNMPQRDKYMTQAPISLIRQIVDHELVYNREALEEQKFIQGTMFFGAMNPKSGSFYIDTRLSRHLTLVSCLTAEVDVLTQIYLQILSDHMKPFDKQCSDLAPRIVKATMSVFMQMAITPQFMPTAQKFHYQFNLRDFAKIIQNMKESQPAIYKGNPKGLARMWAHECHRVWQDRLIKPEDHTAYMNFMRQGCKEFGDIKEDDILAEPLIYTSFVAQCEGHDRTYMEIKGLDHLKEILESKLEEYNE